jgi:hypothetical protein
MLSRCGLRSRLATSAHASWVEMGHVIRSNNVPREGLTALRGVAHFIGSSNVLREGFAALRGIAHVIRSSNVPREGFTALRGIAHVIRSSNVPREGFTGSTRDREIRGEGFLSFSFSTLVGPSRNLKAPGARTSCIAPGAFKFRSEWGVSLPSWRVLPQLRPLSSLSAETAGRKQRLPSLARLGRASAGDRNGSESARSRDRRSCRRDLPFQVEIEARIFEKNAPGVFGEATRVLRTIEGRPLPVSLSPCESLSSENDNVDDRNLSEGANSKGDLQALHRATVATTKSEWRGHSQASAAAAKVHDRRKATPTPSERTSSARAA